MGGTAKSGGSQILRFQWGKQKEGVGRAFQTIEVNSIDIFGQNEFLCKQAQSNLFYLTYRGKQMVFMTTHYIL